MYGLYMREKKNNNMAHIMHIYIVCTAYRVLFDGYLISQNKKICKY